MQPYRKKGNTVARLSERLDWDSRCLKMILSSSQLPTERDGYRMAAEGPE